MSANRLQPLDLADFTGGLVTRRSQFTLADNESPDMLNIDIDPRAGFYTRKGWQRWNALDIDSPSTWDPRSAKLHPLSDGSYIIYVTSGGQLYWAAADGNFAILQDQALTAPIGVSAAPHLADFAEWGDVMYFAPGWTEATPFKRLAGSNGVNNLIDSSTSYNDDYTTPVTGRFPRAEFVETHAGYMFAASIYDEGGHKPNRIRWSHPNQPEDWHPDDFLDIERGGGRITGLLSFLDHLLIFKTDSVWALYGYDLESWQLVNISTSVGVSTMTAFTRSENAVYFFSTSGRGGVFAYTGDRPFDVSEQLVDVMEEVQATEDVWIAWLGRKLWCSLPYRNVESGQSTSDWVPANPATNTVFVLDTDVGEQGAWSKHRCALGSIGPFVERSTVDTVYPMAVVNGDSGAAAVLQLDYRNDCYDIVLASYGATLTDETDGDTLVDATDGLAFSDGSAAAGSPFVAYYRTGWKHAGWPERRKSWRRPRYVARVPDQDVVVRANVYWNYDEANPRRSAAGLFDVGGSVFWRAGGSAEPGGADWGEGAIWGGAARGGKIERVPLGLGVNRAVQLEILSDPSTAGRAWGIDLIHLHYILRGYTT